MGKGSEQEAPAGAGAPSSRSRRPRGQGASRSTLATAIAPLPPDVTVILVTGEPRDRRRRPALTASLLRVLEDQKNRHCLTIDCPELKKPEAVAWAIKPRRPPREAAGTGRRPQAGGAVCRPPLWATSPMEIDKLASYAGQADTITTAHIDAVTPRLIEDHVFGLVEAVAAQNAGRGRGRPPRAAPGAGGKPPSGCSSCSPPRSVKSGRWKLLLDRGWRRGAEVDDTRRRCCPRTRTGTCCERLAASRLASGPGQAPTAGPGPSPGPTSPAPCSPCILCDLALGSVSRED